MARPPLSADRRIALVRLIASYSDVLLAEESEALWQMYGRPALTILDRLQLCVIARCARDRAEGRHAA